jgi:hypothetical protein
VSKESEEIDLDNGPSHKPLWYRLCRALWLGIGLSFSQVEELGCPWYVRIWPPLAFKIAWGIWIGDGCPCWKCDPPSHSSEGPNAGVKGGVSGPGKQHGRARHAMDRRAHSGGGESGQMKGAVSGPLMLWQSDFFPVRRMQP